MIREFLGQALRKDTAYRADNETICDWVAPTSRVLDLGCGGGELLAMLKERKQVRGVGMEKSVDAVAACIHKGVSAYQGDLDQGLADLLSQSYDYVILNQTLQMTHHPRLVMEEALRVGRKVIVGFPNFGYWFVRWQVLEGRTPETKDLPHRWYDTPNLHFMSVLDFEQYAKDARLHLLRRAFFIGNRKVYLRPNLLASSALFELKSEN